MALHVYWTSIFKLRTTGANQYLKNCLKRTLINININKNLKRHIWYLCSNGDIKFLQRVFFGNSQEHKWCEAYILLLICNYLDILLILNSLKWSTLTILRMQIQCSRRSLTLSSEFYFSEVFSFHIINVKFCLLDKEIYISAFLLLYGYVHEAIFE